MFDVISTATEDQIIFTAIWAAILLIATFIFTVLPAKNPDWDRADERV
jgi:NSS family neurotransmitter:Na+ symporter